MQQQMGHDLNKTLFVIFLNLTCFFRKIAAFHTCTPDIEFSKMTFPRAEPRHEIGKVAASEPPPLISFH